MKTKKQENKKTKNQLNFVFLFSCFLVFLIIVDRITKTFFIKNPYYFKNLYLFKLNLAINKNIAFSLAIPQKIIFFLIFSILIFLFYLLIKHCKKKEFTFIFSLSLIIIGALSNFIDRIIYGGVIDFIDVSYFTILNLADIYITTGIILWIIAEKQNSDANYTNI
jgi:signal peptidase II